MNFTQQQKLLIIHYIILWGVFVVLLCGLALAILVAILEFCWNSKKNTQSDRSLCAEMASELRFALRCGSQQRPVTKSRDHGSLDPTSCTRCSPQPSFMRSRRCFSHQETTYIPTIEIPRLNAGSWCAADDGDEEIVELRSCGDVPWRKHLTEAESPPPTKPVAPDTTTTVSVQSHPHVHTSLSLSYSQSQSLAQTSASNAETETDLSEYQHGSRR
ncbi:hypothetical protein KQX54_019240 [Cotesia glomerata]|uniref:Uncharacterized protein n=1 Tax=Cotesia glomerata TaxID=32391 RepID=A0AAV7J9D1_COTGL|nr:hypothetical protein KQX54_019240 [Cotesia glomerata]